MIRQTEKSIGRIQWKEGQGEYRIQTICSRLYKIRTLSADEKRLVHLLAVLPYGKYPAGILKEMLGGRSPARKVDNLLDQLYLKGWLDRYPDGYSMHPLVAESILGNGVKESDFPGLWQYLMRCLPSVSLTNIEDLLNEPVDHLEQARLLQHAAGCLKGDVSAELVDLCLAAAFEILKGQEAGFAVSAMTRRLVKQCPSISWEQQALIQIVGCLFY